MRTCFVLIVMLLLAPTGEASAHKVCDRLLEDLGPARIAHLEDPRPRGALSVRAVCNLVAREAKRQGAPPGLAISLGFYESGLLYKAAKDTKYLGPMAVDPRWCKDKERQCIPDAIGHLLWWKKKRKTWSKALFAYSGGEVKGLSEKAFIRKTQHVAKILALWSRLKED